MPPVPPKIFVSYSHDSPQHKERVLGFAQRLREDGIDAQIDQFVRGRPLEGWPRWMLDKLDWADFVLLFCTETYHRRFRGHEQPDIGKGADWEGQLITSEIYQAKSRTSKFVPVVFRFQDKEFIPEFISDQFYLLDSEEHYLELYRLLTGRSGVAPLELGFLKELPKIEREPLRFEAAGAKKAINLPFAPLGALFKGREAILADLRKRFPPASERAIGPAAHNVIHGLGGVGKTRLAIEYAWRFEQAYCALLFISARSPADLWTNLAGLCDSAVLDLPEQVQPTLAVRLGAVFRWLNEHRGWLLIVDNADTQDAAAEVGKALLKLRNGDVIITSRIADWSASVDATELDVLKETEAAAFLLERTESRRKKMSADSEDAAGIARDLGGLALALEQAGAYVAKLRVSLSEYRKRWESRKAEVLAWYEKRLMLYPQCVAMTWRNTIEELSQSQRKLLNILAWFAPEPIPLSLFEEYIADGPDARDALAGLASWSLARWMADEGRFTVHRLVQEVTRGRLLDEERSSTLSSALGILGSALPSPEWDAEGWRQWDSLIPHVRAVLRHFRSCPNEYIATPVMNQYALLLCHRAQYFEAEELYRRALAIDEEHLGPDHADVANRLNNLAGLLSETNRQVEAEPLYRRALAIDEKRLGPDDPSLATPLNNLAGLLSETNRLTEAEPLYRRALAIDEKRFGPEHPSVAIRLNNLAGLLGAMNRMAEAEPLYRRALTIDEKGSGPRHPTVAIRLNNLGWLLGATNRMAEAEPLYQRALKIDEGSLGLNHPSVAICLNNLAGLLSATKRMTEAEPLYRRALAIDEKCFGPDHPNVAIRLNNLAGLLRATNRMAESELLYRRALAIDEKGSGGEHPSVAIRLSNLASLLRATNRMAEAEALYRRALAMDEKSSGADHPKSAIRLNNLAGLLRATNRFTEAEPLYRRALAIDEKSFGPEHPRVAITLNNLAGLLSATNRLAEAEPLYRRALAIDEKSFGPDHSNVAICINNLAGLLGATDRLVEAELMYRRALAIDERGSEADHPSIAIHVSNLASLLAAMSRFAEAEPLYRRAIAIDERSFGLEHPRVANILNNFALLLRETNRLTEAEQLERRAAAINEKSFSPEHQKVSARFINYAGAMGLSEEEIVVRFAPLAPARQKEWGGPGVTS
jgi:tetratricopeptide (TPR) repeat protein